MPVMWLYTLTFDCPFATNCLIFSSVNLQYVPEKKPPEETQIIFKK